MYLVHAELCCGAGAALPVHADRLIADAADADEGLEHVVVHEDEAAGLLVGLFILAATVEDAERLATLLVTRAVESVPELAGFTVGRCGVRMVPGYYSRQVTENPGGLDMPRHD
ncbi:hypothetical protein [Streptomyces sp. NBC_01264]|uniref:hypothetical protein n=1 Tax=Streptomyces sp. NBC_01264 TaxID=2903804 RepID=UPI0022539C30|nr:hypothetical protein [Streptomyces sp. NBC_01264]MCX4784187.1 hypothetical protein [Streptomyces sp. NBC_01264]